MAGVAAFVVAGIAAILFAVISSPALAGPGATAAATPPDLTGQWVNKAAPHSGPPWQLKASNGLQTLDASWKGGKGHTDLRGSFHGSLASGGNAYHGTFHATEVSVVVDGTGTFTIDNANQIEIDLQPNNGGSASHYTFVRVGAGGPVSFSFHGYSNDVRVLPPLVGAFQLGKSYINGSGTLSHNSIRGNIVDRFHLHGGPTAVPLDARVVSYHKSTNGAATVLTMTIAVTSTGARKCAVGDRATLTLVDNPTPLSNHKRSDSIEVHWFNQRCPTFEQGWTNRDQGPKSDPPFGGPPNGGQWAIVRISG